ncbi:DNA recombination protein RmuC [Rhodoligotrophos defluvii]|uniref:DNA recombination protein RmuC n=1 Tax=Rhodoligotrophos defluvii TaxID=2561934 RepID=UPI0014856E79|nr:DNA recombination protein RmuC [Rhodoligotrophos defluvii]
MLDLDQPLLLMAGLRVSYIHAAAAFGVAALLLLAACLFLAWRAARRGREAEQASLARTQQVEQRLVELSGQLRSFADIVASRESHLARTLDQRLDLVARRTGDGLGQIHERLAVIDRAQRNITELTSKVVSLQEILSNKQARGAFGQARMEAIIRDGLPMGTFGFQASLSNGTRPDCLVDLPETGRKLVIDAKFPLEAFSALKAARSEGESRMAAQRLRQDVAKHIKDIAGKYLISGETHDTAVMFVPSEAIYADLYEHFEDVIQQAHRARVIIASPNILMLVVQTLQAVFKDVRMREQAGLIKAEVAAILDDVGRLHDRVLDLKKHFGQANQDIEKIAISADKIARRGVRIEQMELSPTAAGAEAPAGSAAVTGPSRMGAAGARLAAGE